DHQLLALLFVQQEYFFLGVDTPHSTTVPPLRLTTVPVRALARSDAMKTATLASSASVVRRPRCVVLSNRARYSARVMPAAFANFSKLSRIVPVSGIAFGMRHTTRTPRGASSAERVRLSATTAANAGALPPTFGNAMRLGVAVIVKMTPDRRATIRRAALRAVRKFASV